MRLDDARDIPTQPGETVAEALLAAGVLATTRSLKFRRHRGPYCLTGDCGTCLMRIDGKPNLRACMLEVRDGMVISSQNRVGPRGTDPTGLADKVFAKGMDHHHLMVRPRVLNEMMKSIARNLAGLGTIASQSAVDTLDPEHTQWAPDVLVIGAGAAGQAFAETVRTTSTLRCVVVDRLNPGRLPAPTSDDLWQTGVFGIYADEGVVAAYTPARDGSDRDTLHTFTPRHLVFAMGARDPLIPLQNNDLPGVLSGRGLQSVLAAGRFEVDAVVVVGHGDAATTLAETLGARLVAPTDVVDLLGTKRVEAVKTTTETLKCSLVALAPAPCAASELPRQAGAAVVFDGSSFNLCPDRDGQVQTRGPWQAWACGDICGYVGPAAAAAQARTTAHALLGTKP